MLALLTVVSGCLLMFLWLAGEVTEGDTGVFDRTILLAFRNAADPTRPLGPIWLETLARDITSLGSTTVLTIMTLFMIGLLLLLRARLEALQVIGAMGGGSLLNTVLKHLFDRQRPDLLPHVVEAMNASFPSGHATMSTVAYLILGTALTRLSLARLVKVYILCGAVSLPLLIGLSRIYLGVHWPTDVLAGWCLGASWALLWWMVLRWLRRDNSTAPKEDSTSPFRR
ncbi:phosphatase PAP2 family protein [Azospirillum sp. TSA2s]|uniref:phosphatase PAP2 family protein n=1 Tax=Azospirillum sp. TSA2s TaxID=709810 RepID=UPI001FFECF9B|nr:phosphatase PAP2 family protein [Azospirillum sp. TSA2s]